MTDPLGPAIATHDPIQPKLFPSSIAAAKLDLSLSELKNLRRRGELGYFKMGRKVRFNQRQIDAYLATREVKPSFERQASQSKAMSSPSVTQVRRITSAGTMPWPRTPGRNRRPQTILN